MSNTGYRESLKTRVGGPSGLPVPRVRAMSSRSTATSIASSRPSPTWTAPPAPRLTSPSSAASTSPSTPDANSGSGNSDEDGSARLSSLIDQKKIAFSRLLKQAMETRGVTAPQLSTLTGVSVHSINRYRSTCPQLPRPATAAALADALMEPRLRSIASVSRICVTCSTVFELISKKRMSNRYCSQSCQRAARNENDQAKSNTRLSAERSRATAERDRLQLAIRAFCEACTLPSKVCPDAECPLASVTPLPMRKHP